MPFSLPFRRNNKPAGEPPLGEARLFFANVVDEATLEEEHKRSLYLVLAYTESEAIQFIRGARLGACDVGMRQHSLPVATAIKSYGLTYGAARLVWPREDESQKPADDYLFIDEPRNAEDVVLLGVMRGAPQSVTSLKDLLPEQCVSAA